MHSAMKKLKVYKDKRGYFRFRDSDKLVHRRVLEKFFGHKLSPRTVVHHKNRDKTDNRRENLWAWSNQKRHDAIHKKDKRRFGHW
ncbi:MAG: hypothetical protein E3J60_00445 [Dehalococcoidia bacterium]|nr:MAG: hypothetical protein E3J60_00445 [Dehalococcoidia bacterium]